VIILQKQISDEDLFKHPITPCFRYLMLFSSFHSYQVTWDSSIVFCQYTVRYRYICRGSNSYHFTVMYRYICRGSNSTNTQLCTIIYMEGK